MRTRRRMSDRDESCLKGMKNENESVKDERCEMS